MEDGGTGKRCLGWVFLQLCSAFPRTAVIPTTRRHRLWSRARDGMISVAFAFQIHQSSDKESHSIQILKYFFLFHVESSYHCRELQKSAEIKI